MSRLQVLWLKAGALYGVIAGLAIIALALLPERLPFGLVTRILFWPNGERAGVTTASALLATAVSGALTVGIAVMAWALLPTFLDQRVGAMARRGFAQGVCAWFVLDSMSSVAVGASLNVLGNTTLLFALVFPLFWPKPT